MRLPLLLSALLVAAVAAGAQSYVSLDETRPITLSQRVLPAVGPGSARANPAAVAETRLGYGLYGRYRSRSGELEASAWQMAVAFPDHLNPSLPIGLAAGFGGYEDNRRIEASNAIHQESDLGPAFAVSFPRDRKAPVWGAIGMAFPRRTYNAFNALRMKSTSLDLGGLLSLDLHGSRVRLGAAYLGAEGHEVKLPDGRGTFEVPGRHLWTAGWLSRGESVRIHWGWFLYDDDDVPDAGGVDGWEFEYRPIRLLALKAERTLLGGESCLGVILRPKLGAVELDMELNLGHDEYEPIGSLEWIFGKDLEEGRGFSLAYSLAAGF